VIWKVKKSTMNFLKNRLQRSILDLDLYFICTLYNIYKFYMNQNVLKCLRDNGSKRVIQMRFTTSRLKTKNQTDL